MNSSSIWMKPWRGRDYASRKLLVVGESAYDTSDYKVNPFTNIEIIWDEVTGRVSHRTQMKIADLCGEQSKSFWHSVAFYNFIQDRIPNSKHRPKDGSFERSRRALSCLLGLHGDAILNPRPTHIIAVGKTVTWEEMPACKFDANNWCYALQGYGYPDGSIGLATYITHPGTRRAYPSEQMKRRLKCFLSLPPSRDAVDRLLTTNDIKLFS